MSFGITSDGFALKGLQDIIAEYNAAYIAIYGDPNLADDSVIGQRRALESNMLALIWEGVQLAYNAPFPSLTDEGSIDNVMAVNGLTRKPATATTVLCDCVFSGAGTIPAGSLIANAAGNIFAALADIVAGGAGTVEGSFACTVTGPTPMPAAGTLTIQTPYSGWTSVAVHAADISSVAVGSNLETLAEARVRRVNELLISGSATLAAIAAAVQNNVATVSFCVAIDWTTNPADVTFGYIRVIAQSTEAYPIETPDYTERAAIAAQIWAKRAGGIPMQGAISQVITDSTGRTQTVNFDYVTDTAVTVAANYSLFPSDPTPPPADISAALTDAISTAFSAQGIGENVLYFRILGACAAVPGIKINTLTLNAGTSDISVSSFSRGNLSGSPTITVT